jgi:hypothetical protein
MVAWMRIGNTYCAQVNLSGERESFGSCCRAYLTLSDTPVQCQCYKEGHRMSTVLDTSRAVLADGRCKVLKILASVITLVISKSFNL